MEKLDKFSEDYKTYLKAYDSIEHFRIKSREETNIYIKQLRDKLLNLSFIKECNLNPNSPLTLNVKINGFKIYLDLSPYYLKENKAWISFDNKKSLDEKILVSRLKECNGFNPKYKNPFWIEIDLNAFDIKDMDEKIIAKLKEVNKALSKL